MRYVFTNNKTVAILATLTMAAMIVFIGHYPWPHIEPMVDGFGLMPIAFAGSTDSIVELIKKQGEEFESFKNRYDGEFKKLSDGFKAEQARADDLEKRMNRPGWSGSSGGHGDMSAEARKAVEAFARQGDSSGLEHKSMSGANDPSGGYLIPPEIDSQIEKLIKDQSPFRALANVRPATTSDYKKIVSHGGLDSGWVGDTQDRGDTATPTFAEITIPARELFAMPKITQTLLDDAGFDAANWLIDEISEAFAIAEGSAFISGDGVLKPRGLLSYEAVATADATRAFGKLQFIASGSATEVTPNSLVTMPYKLKAGYRQDAVWLMNSATAATLMTIKDSQQRFLWIDGLKEGQPATLAGYRVVICEDMPDIAGNAYPIAFGNFKRGYTITNRKQTTILRDPYTAKPYVKFYAVRRVGGAMVNYHAIKLLKITT